MHEVYRYDAQAVKRRPRRTLLLSGLLLLAWGAGGAIINVAVAWGFLLLRHSTQTAVDMPNGYWPDHDPLITVYGEAAIGYRNVGAHWHRDEKNGRDLLLPREHFQAGSSALPAWAFVRELSQAELALEYLYYDAAWGWPALALHSCIEFDLDWLPSGDCRMDVKRTIGGTTPHWFRDSALNGWYAIPLSPIWPGFAINTVFYAVILWGLFAAPFALRRRRRIKRGLCPTCAYDLRGAGRGSDSAACPECGTPTATMPKP